MLIENKTKETLTVAMPEAFVGIHVLNQFGQQGGQQGGGGGGGGGQSTGGGQQAVGKSSRKGEIAENRPIESGSMPSFRAAATVSIDSSFV